MFPPSLRGRTARHAFVVVALVAAPALAAEAACAVVGRENLVSCAQAHSPLLTAAEASVRASEGRVEAARPFLPSNPVLSGSLASRTSAAARATNWYLTLEQELEVAGQSGLRVETAEGERTAEQHRLAVARAEVAEQAWRAWFEVLAARERAALAQEVERASLALAATVQGMTTHGLASVVDAAVADAEALRATQARLDAEREEAAVRSRLRAALGLPDVAPVTGGLVPLRHDEGAPAARPERQALEALRHASARRLELLRRERAPNPKLSLFAQNDGFDERVLGVGVGVPIPLPQPVGRTNAGPIAEAMAEALRLEAELERLDRELQAEQAQSVSDLQGRERARALYTPERLARAREGLTALGEQLAAGRLAIREALVSQHALVELLQGDLEARLALCLASVRWRRAHGLTLEGGAL